MLISTASDGGDGDGDLDSHSRFSHFSMALIEP